MIVNQQTKRTKHNLLCSVWNPNSEDCTVQNLIILKQRNHMIESM